LQQNADDAKMKRGTVSKFRKKGSKS